MTMDALLERPEPGAAARGPARRAIIEETRLLRREFLINLRANAPAVPRPIRGLPGSLRSGTRPGLSQEAVAEAMSISSRAYRNLEAGDANWSEDLLRLFERAVGLDREGEQAASMRQVLWNLLIGKAPRSSVTVLTAADRLHIDSQRVPSYLSNDWWEMVHGNDAMAQWFPDLTPGTNIMIWCMSEAGSRQLLDWEASWVRPMLAQLRAAYYNSLNGNSELAERLGTVLAEVLESDVVRRYWKKDKFRFHVGPNGNVRRMLHPREGEKTILLWSAQALGTPNTRVMHVYEMRESGGVLEPVPPCAD